jgi:hypothetical protein
MLHILNNPSGSMALIPGFVLVLTNRCPNGRAYLTIPVAKPSHREMRNGIEQQFKEAAVPKGCASTRE